MLEMGISKLISGINDLFIMYVLPPTLPSLPLHTGCSSTLILFQSVYHRQLWGICFSCNFLHLATRFNDIAVLVGTDCVL